MSLLQQRFFSENQHARSYPKKAHEINTIIFLNYSLIRFIYFIVNPRSAAKTSKSWRRLRGMCNCDRIIRSNVELSESRHRGLHLGQVWCQHHGRKYCAVHLKRHAVRRICHNVHAVGKHRRGQRIGWILDTGQRQLPRTSQRSRTKKLLADKLGIKCDDCESDLGQVSKESTGNK